MVFLGFVEIIALHPLGKGYRFARINVEVDGCLLS
jgi:hypothetical protein